MSTRGFISSFVVLTLAAPAFAQESKAFFDAAVVVGDHQTRFQKLGDINGDGYMDAYSGWWGNSSYDSLKLSAFINDGAGKLSRTWTVPAAIVPSLTSVWSFDAGDVNSDGLADLVVGVGIRVYLYVIPTNGGTPTAITWDVAGPNVTGVALVNFDGDGVPEIAVLNGGLTILRYDIGVTDDLIPVASLALNANGGELRQADVDQTGSPDLIAWDATRVWMIPMHGVTPLAPTTFLHGRADPRGAAGDIDNDGDEDVVVFDMGTYVVFRRTSATGYTQEPVANGGPARFLYDLDGDGALDGVCCGGGGPSSVANNAPSIFRIAMNDGTGHFAPALEMPGLGSVRLAGAADLDHDGDLDLVAGRCVFYSPAKLLEDMPRTFPFAARDNAFADLEGDMDPDLEPGTSTKRNLGDGTFATFAPVLPAPPAGRTWIGPGYPGDFDGDGDLDLVVQQQLNGSFEEMQLMKNAGGGSFVDGGPAGAPGVDFAYSSAPPRARDAIIDDVDGDGDVDIIVTQAPLADSKIYWNDGQGSFVAGPSWANSMLVRYVADMNGDAVPDLVGYYRHNTGGWSMSIMLGVPGGSFGEPFHTFWSNSLAGGIDVFDIGDADGDGDIDMVGTNFDDLRLFVNNTPPGGALSFSYELIVYQAVAGSGSGVPHGALFVDADVDGKLDVVCWPVSTFTFSASNSSYVLRRNSGNTGYEPAVYQAMMPSGKLDLDGDGDEDMFGTHLFKNRTFESVEGGIRKQTVDGIAGAGGIVPTLGASGPFRVGEQAEVVLTGATGGINGMWYQHYLGETPPPFTGGIHQGHAHLYYPPAHFTTSGRTGGIGGGRWSHSFEVPGYVAGQTKVYYVTLHDTYTPTGFARSNTLYVTYGP